MAIRLNYATLSSNKLNGDNVTFEKLNGTVVYWGEVTTTAQWQYVGYNSSEPDSSLFDLYTEEYIDGDYEQGLNHLDYNFPASGYYEGFVAVVYDRTYYNYFEYVVVLV